MKKLISILLSLIMLISFTVPASASFADVVDGAKATADSFVGVYEDVENENYGVAAEDSARSFQYLFITVFLLLENLSRVFDFENPFADLEYQGMYLMNVISTTLENPEFVAADNEATNVLANGD